MSPVPILKHWRRPMHGQPACNRFKMHLSSSGTILPLRRALPITSEVIDFTPPMPDYGGRRTLKMTSQTELIDRYIAAWNEVDPQSRKDLIGCTWTEDSTYLDPMTHG